MRTIRTKFLPPTDCRGARIKAHLVEDLHDGTKPETITLSFTYAFPSTEDEHRNVARGLLDKLADKWGNGWERNAYIENDGLYIGNAEYVFCVKFKPVK